MFVSSTELLELYVDIKEWHDADESSFKRISGEYVVYYFRGLG